MDTYPRHQQFPQAGNLVYFNHAAVAPWPRVTAEAVKAFAQENLELGAKLYPKWMQTEQDLRTALRQLIHAESTDDIALLKNTSEGLSVIAYGLEWHAGDNIVIPAGEFPSNRIVWQSLQQYGVETREVDILNTENPEAALITAMDERTRLLSVSAVQYSNGQCLDLITLGNYCRQHEILYVVDAIQHIGALVFDVQAIGADFAVADGHKWMLGPEGLALFYARPEARDLLHLKQYGWHILENMGDFTQKTIHITQSARRFECGSPNMLGIHALLASITWILEEGIENIQRNILKNTQLIIDYINNSDKYTLLGRHDTTARSGIVTFRHHSLSDMDAYKTLMGQGLVCAARGGGVRFSPHYYHQDWEFERAFELLDSL